MKRVVLCVLLFAAPSARAEVSTFAIGPAYSVSFASEAVLTEGSRPAFLPVEHDYTQRRLWLHMRASAVLDTAARGTQIGTELEMRLGLTESESDPLRKRLPVGFAGRWLVVWRPLTFNVPVDGMLVFLAGGELGAGGAVWWSNSVMLSPLVGARLATRWMGELRVEAEYLLIPHVITGSPRHMDIDRLEHRAAVRVAYGPLAVGASALMSREHVRSRDRTQIDTTGERSLGVLVEWRL